MNQLVRFGRVFSLTAKYAHRARKAQREPEKARLQALHVVMRDWARATTGNLNLEIVKSGALPSVEPVLFFGNHLSYLDIPVLMALTPVVFVAKSELGKWPFIGPACRSAGTVMVKRDCKDSRKQAGYLIAETCKTRKQSVCVFPSGTTSLNESAKPWKKGVFEIAYEHGLKMQPFRLNYSPREKSAFIGEDALVPHLWRLLQEPKLTAHIELHEPVSIDSPEKDCERWRKWACAEILT